MNDWRTLKNKILKDVRVELLDEFDQNFTRKAFFDQPWPQRSYPGGRGTLMICSGRGRRSFRGVITQNEVTFSSDTPYMALHQTGGKVPITPRMRKFFWAMYYKNKGQGKAPGLKALYWRGLALTPKKSISIPARPVLGDHPRVRDVVNRCINDNLQRSVKSLADVLNKHR